MGKWLALAGIALLAVLLVLWKQLETTEAAPQIKKPAVVAEAHTPAAAEPLPTAPVADTKPVEAEPEKPKKIDVESDAFVYQFQDVTPKVLTRNAAKCYEGIAKRVHRNQKLSLDVTMRIKDGEVTVADVKIKESTLENPGLESCFIQEVKRSSWHDDTLPDWEGDETLVLRPERGMKKFMQDNVNYVGEPAPQD